MRRWEQPDWFTSILVASSRLLNTVLGGYSGEMLSSRLYREGWHSPVKLLDKVFFWQTEHCRSCYEWEQDGIDRPFFANHRPNHM
jgi:hypothetical protein